MKRLVTTGALALSILAAPAAAHAATQTGTVLNANRGSHRIEVVDSRHVVHSYVLTGRVGKRARNGSKVAFQARGKQASHLRVTGRSRKVAFFAKVVANGSKGVVLKLGDGRRFRVTAGKKKRHAGRHARAAGTVTLNIQGLQPGETVLITQTSDGAGNVTITVKIVPNADENGGEDQDAVGTVTAVGGSSITIDPGDGSGPMTFQADPDLLDGVSVGDQVDVTYYQDTDGTLVADDIEPADDGSGDGSDDQDAIGAVTAVGDSSITIDPGDGSGAMTFQADPDLLDGVSVGDQVDVTYYQDTDGTLVADDVEPADDGSGDDSGDGSGDSGSGDSTPSGGDTHPSGPLTTVLPPLSGGGRHGL